MPIATFSFEDLSSKDKALRQMTKTFARLGAHVVQSDVPSTVKRTAGISYREVNLTFADSQVVSFRVKKTGDIYEVRLNNRPLPIRAQDDQAKAIKEIVDAMDSGRAAFQRKLAKAQVKVPSGLKTAAPKMEKVLSDKVAALKEAIEAVRKQIADYKAKTAEIEQQIALLQSEAAAA